MNRRPSPLRALALPLLGFAMLIASLLWGARIDAFPGWLLGMGGSSVALIIVGLLWQDRGSLRDSVLSLAYSLFVLLALVFVYLLAANRSQRIDLTRSHIHTLSDQTRSFLASLQTPIRVTYFAEPRDQAQARQFFELYEADTSKLSFEIFDPQTEIGVARRFDEHVVPGDTYATILIEGKEEQRSHFAFKTDHQFRESILTNELVKLERGRQQAIYFLSGHGERSLGTDPDAPKDATIAAFRELVQKNIMPVKTVNLVRESRVPADAAVVVIAGPPNDLFDPERELLINYLDEGGSLMVLLDPQFVDEDLANLKTVLGHAGIAAPNTVLIDRLAPRNPEVILTDKGSAHPIVGRMKPDAVVQLFIAREVDPSPGLAPEGSRVAMPLLVSQSSVWTENPADLMRRKSATAPEDKSSIKVRPVSVASSWPVPGAARRDEARIVVVGDSDFLTNTNIGKDASLFALHSLNWLTQRDDLLDIPPNFLKPSKLVLTQKRFWLMVGSLIAFGLAILVGGVGATTARRRLG